MSVVALATWITAAGGGLYLLSIWLIEYDKEFQSAAATRLPPLVLAGHVLLAVGGLIVWAAYLFFDDDDLTWIAVAALGMAAALGLFMAYRWVGVYRGGRREARAQHLSASPDAAAERSPDTGAVPLYAAAPVAGAASDVDHERQPSPATPAVRTQPQLSQVEAARMQAAPPERNFPLPVVIGHGIFAFVTITLVVLVAFGVGGS